MVWIPGVDSSFDELTLEEAQRLRDAGVKVFAQCLWTGNQQPPPRIISLRNAQQVDMILIGNISVSPSRNGIEHVDAARAGIPDDLWEALAKTPIDVELPNLQYVNHVVAAWERSLQLGKPRDTYTSFNAWVNLLQNPIRPPGVGLWNALWDLHPDFDFPTLRYGGWQDNEVWGEQWSGGTLIEGQFADRNQFLLEALAQIPLSIESPVSYTIDTRIGSATALLANLWKDHNTRLLSGFDREVLKWEVEQL